jgi:hypothetical protein
MARLKRSFSLGALLLIIITVLELSCRSRCWEIRVPSLPSYPRQITQETNPFLGSNSRSSPTTRRGFCTSSATSLLVGAAGLSSSNLLLPPDAATAATGSLATKLSKQDPAALVSSIFNIPPSTQVYPEFLRGTWQVTCRYGGYLFPSQKIPREQLTANAQIPGFQKCSIVALSDVGKESFDYTLSIDEATGVEDRATSLTTQINANLGYSAVSEILYNPKSNPNRLSIDFVEYRTRNAERIELFVNGRESEFVPETQVFVCSEYLRQVTFGTGSTVGVPRQAATNYAHFWTWKKNADDPSVVTGNLLTAAYLDPQDPLFFDEPSRPVAVYSHVLKGVKVG